MESNNYKSHRIISCNLLDNIFYEEIITESNVLKATISKGTSTLSSFDLLTQDVFNLLYKVVITFNDDSRLSYAALQNKPIVEYLYNSTILSKLRNRTQGSLPNTAIGIKYILDEVISKLRGSDISKILRLEQQRLLDLYTQRENLSNILDNFLNDSTTNDHASEISGSDFPFNENIKLLLADIHQNEHISKKGYNLTGLLESIASISKEYMVDGSLLDELDSNMILNKSIYNAINNLRNSFNEKSTNNNESMLEDFLDEVRKEVSNNSEIDNTTSDQVRSKESEDNQDSSEILQKDPDNKSETDEAFEKEFKNTLDYVDERLSSFKNNNTMIKEVLSSLNKTDLLIESTNEGIDDIVIIDSNGNETKRQVDEYFLINEKYSPNLNDQSYNRDKSPHKLAKGSDFSELIAFISNAIEFIDNKINFTKNSMKKQLESLNFDKVINESIEVINAFDNNIGLLNVNKSSLTSLSFDDIINMSKYFNDADIKKFLDKVGRKKEIAKRSSAKIKKDKTIISDKILLSNDIENIIDEELMMFSMDIEAFEDDFYDRYLHNRLLTYEKVKPKERNKGPIILCYDGSGSMDGNKIKETKVHIISFIEVARIQKRKMITIQFASKEEPLIIKEINPNSVCINDIYDIMNDFIRGGTDFEKPLEKAIEFIKADRFKHADILFITDGVCNISEAFKKRFISNKKNMEFKLYSVIMHGNTYSDYGDIGDISDEIMEIKSMNLNSWNEKISERIFSI